MYKYIAVNFQCTVLCGGGSCCSVECNCVFMSDASNHILQWKHWNGHWDVLMTNVFILYNVMVQVTKPFMAETCSSRFHCFNCPPNILPSSLEFLCLSKDGSYLNTHVTVNNIFAWLIDPKIFVNHYSLWTPTYFCITMNRYRISSLFPAPPSPVQFLLPLLPVTCEHPCCTAMQWTPHHNSTMRMSTAARWLMRTKWWGGEHRVLEPITICLILQRPGLPRRDLVKAATHPPCTNLFGVWWDFAQSSRKVACHAKRSM